jgi:hypothetical protein
MKKKELHKQINELSGMFDSMVFNQRIYCRRTDANDNQLFVLNSRISELENRLRILENKQVNGN